MFSDRSSILLTIPTRFHVKGLIRPYFYYIFSKLDVKSVLFRQAKETKVFSVLTRLRILVAPGFQACFTCDVFFLSGVERIVLKIRPHKKSPVRVCVRTGVVSAVLSGFNSHKVVILINYNLFYIAVNEVSNGYSVMLVYIV